MRHRYPIKDMEAGQSVLITEGLYSSIKTLGTHYGKKLGRVYRTKKTREGVLVTREA